MLEQGLFAGKDIELIYLRKTLEAPKAKRNETRRQEDRLERTFYAMGFYDRISYIKPGGDEVFDFQRAFSILYPYQKKAQNDPAATRKNEAQSELPSKAFQCYDKFEGEGHIAADQMFALVKLPQANQNEPGPFATTQKGFPFLGIILVTLDITNDSSEPLVEMAVGLEKLCCEKYEDSIVQAYIIPNCTDIGVVMRTNEPKSIYELHRFLESDNERLPSFLNVSVIWGLSIDKDDYDELNVNNFKKTCVDFRLSIKSNKDVISCYDKIEGLCNKKIYVSAISGTGDYAFSIPLYPYLQQFQKSLAETDSIDFSRILQDRLRFECSKDDLKDEYQKAKKISNANNSPDSKVWPFTYIESLMTSLRAQLQNDFFGISDYSVLYKHQIHLIQDLRHTYDKLCIDMPISISALLFFAQMHLLLQGTSESLRDIVIVRDKGDKESQEKIESDLIHSIRLAVIAINDYNKAVQAFRINAVNRPHYEIQSKVNIEKYMLAYSEYLLQICNVHFESKVYQTNAPEEKIFPFVFIDIESEIIQANTLFGCIPELEHKSIKENGNIPRWSIFAVHCPDYMSFADAYTLLPLLTHEISHNLRYIPRKERNESVAEFCIQYSLGKIIRRFVMRENKDNVPAFLSPFEQFLQSTIQDELLRQFKEFGENILNLYPLSSFPSLFSRYISSQIALAIEHNGEPHNSAWVQTDHTFKDILQQTQLFHGCQSAADTKTSWKGSDTPQEKMFLCVAACSMLAFVLDGIADLKNSSQEALEEISRELKVWEEFFSQQNVCDDAIAGTALGIVRGLNGEIEQAINPKNDTQSKLQKYQVFEISCEQIETIICALLPWTVWQKCYTLMVETKAKISSERFENLCRNCEEFFYEKEPLSDAKMNELEQTLQSFWNDAQTFSQDSKHRLTQVVQFFCELKLNIQMLKETMYKAPVIRYSLSAVQQLSESVFYKVKEYLSQYKEIGQLKSTQSAAMQLGLFDSTHDAFSEKFSAFFESIRSNEMIEAISLDVQLYDEVFADLGMCAAFSFTPFGFLRFCATVYEQFIGCDNQMNTKSFWTTRIKMVIEILLIANMHQEPVAEEQLDDNNYKVGYTAFANSVFEYLNTNGPFPTEELKKEKSLMNFAASWLKKMEEGIKEQQPKSESGGTEKETNDDSIAKKKEFTKKIEVKKTMAEILLRCPIATKNEDRNFGEFLLAKHGARVYAAADPDQSIRHSKWVKLVQNQNADNVKKEKSLLLVKKIGEFYNSEISNQEKELCLQTEFVLEYSLASRKRFSKLLEERKGEGLEQLKNQDIERFQQSIAQKFHEILSS